MSTQRDGRRRLASAEGVRDGEPVAKKRSSSRAPLLAGLVAALALLVAHLLDCLPGFGTGGDPSTGVPTTAEPAPAEPAPQPEPEQAEGAGPVAIVVRGSQCELGEAPPSSCEEVCERLQAEGTTEQAVEIHATHGSHGVVETLERCLSEAGFSKVEVRSE